LESAELALRTTWVLGFFFSFFFLLHLFFTLAINGF
jgi:hypothetical protein